jgi:hypothetical protein
MGLGAMFAPEAAQADGGCGDMKQPAGSRQSVKQDSHQENESMIKTKQTNVNVNASPAIALFGKADSSQDNDNVVVNDVDQENESYQKQAAFQKQEAAYSGDSRSKQFGKSGGDKSGEHGGSGAEQSVEQNSEQENKSKIKTEQTNYNVNASPAIALFGHADSSQDNDNVVVNKVEQENESHQEQGALQHQEPDHPGGNSYSKGDGYKSGGHGVSGAEQSVEQDSEQENESEIWTRQTNNNVSSSPAFVFKGKADSSQDNDNVVVNKVEQENESHQKQAVLQHQEPDHSGGNSYSKRDGYKSGGSGAEQSVEQTSDQENESEIVTEQTNNNVNASPAVALFGHADSSQDNDNVAVNKVEQENDSGQTQFVLQSLK